MAGGFKAAMTKIQNNIKKTNEEAESFEKKNEQAHRNYCAAIGKQQALKERITQTEENIERAEMKVKENFKLVEEKEQFSVESQRCNTRLKAVKVKETKKGGSADETKKKVTMYKDLYRQNYEKYEDAQSRKCDLESQYDIVERNSKDKQRKLAAMKLEIQNYLVEEGRRAEGCKQSVDLAFKAEKNCLDLERYLDAVLKRTEKATKKITQFQSKITKLEDELEATSFERRTVEATIREILKSQPA